MDESRYDDRRAAEGWLDWQRPAYVGALSALVVDGNVRAKTGSIISGRALSGTATTVGGRDVVFSVVVNGTAPEAAERAIDELVRTVVSHPG